MSDDADTANIPSEERGGRLEGDMVVESQVLINVARQTREPKVPNTESTPPKKERSRSAGGVVHRLSTMTNGYKLLR